ncbi:MAG TPA: GNAT family N-acetyltransferase [Candidatus Polarisedimenticolaceae bacterium]|nr:GNAT family N-acetyltransferase [Candidatus Polarisedimenticolaceae bacterium]
MAGYRFCRSDDLAELVAAYASCYRVHLAECPVLTLDELKHWIRDYGVWASSCMLAYSDRGEVVGVLIGAKRENDNGILAVGVRADQQRAGHGSHMLTSLANKLAILGPPTIVAEVPETAVAARACFESLGYVAWRSYTDFRLTAGSGPAAQMHPLVGTIDVERAGEAGLLEGRDVCWNRASESLLRRSAVISGLALASDRRIEACLLYSTSDDGRRARIELIHLPDKTRGAPLLGLVAGQLLASGPSVVELPRAHEQEVPFDLLRTVGFRATGSTIGYRVRAGSG